MKNCHIAKCIKALEGILGISAIVASITLLTAVLVVPYHMFFLKITLALAIVILISMIILNRLTTSSES